MSLFPSTLIVAPNLQIARENIDLLLQETKHQRQNDPDLFVFSEYNIATVRQAKAFLSQKPFHHQTKVILIESADKLNSESQNALLKTLEEPGKDNFLLLSTTNPALLLPTITSRCQVKRIKYSTAKSTAKIWEITGNPQKDLNFAATLFTDKNEIKSLLREQLDAYHQLFVSSPDPQITQNIKKLLFSLNLIESNVDPKSALDYFFLR